MRVLCVEDNPDVAQVLQEFLTDVGYTVELAYDGAEALVAVEAGPPDVVLLDVNLPDIDGFTLCTLFREKFGMAVIMVTAQQSDDDVVTGFEHGADDYITKPFNLQILRRRIEAVTLLHQGVHAGVRGPGPEGGAA